MTNTPRPLTVGLRANTILGAPTVEVAVEVVQRVSQESEYAVHVLTPPAQVEFVHHLLTKQGINAEINLDRERQFWNSPDTVLVTSSVIQGDVRVGRGVISFGGDWDRTLEEIRELPGTYSSSILLRFDGLVHDRRGYQQGRLQEDVPGALEALRSLLIAGHVLHISTQRPTAQLADIATWLMERGVPAVADDSPTFWSETGTVLVTGSVLATDLDIETRALTLHGNDWGPVLAELPKRRESLLAYFSAQNSAPAPTQDARMTRSN